LAGHYRHEGKERETSSVVEKMPAMPEIPTGRVLVTFYEGMPAHERWPTASEPIPQESGRWIADSFVIPRLPVRYDAWGIRQGWKGPVLLRAAADLKLPPGKQRFMLRARGLSRLWVNGNVVARTKQPTGNT